MGSPAETFFSFLETPLDPTKKLRTEAGKRSAREAKVSQLKTTEAQSKATSEAGRKERERRLRALGRSGTIITGGRGLTEKATVTRKTLLGE